MDIVITVVGKIAEYTVAPVLRQFGYLIYYKSQVEDLTEKITNLTAKRDGVQRRVEAEKRNLQVILPEVQNWLDRVDEIIQEKETCFERGRVDKATACCSSNWWCSNLKDRHSLSRKAAKMAPKVDDLITEGDFTTISYPPPPPKIEYQVIPYFEAEAPAKPHDEGASSSSGTSNPAKPHAAMDLSERLKYRLPYTRDLLTTLQDDKISMIGISGRFREIDTVSTKEFTKRMKQRDLFEEVMLDLTLENGSLVQRAEWLRAVLPALDSKRILVILTDVWGILDLKAIGISGIDIKKGCKIVLISQLSDVFGEMKCSQSNFRLLLPSTPITRPVEFESRISVIRDVMDALTDDEFNPIVICGMGGIGKTTLLKEIGAKASEVYLFDEIAFVEITQQAELIQIQGKIANKLDLELKAEDDTSDRAAKLRTRLSEDARKVLVVLDDVWTDLNLWEVGIPESCKLLVSSRNRDIFKQMKTKKNFPIGGLTEDDGWSLFKKMTGSSIESEPEMRDIAKQVLNACDGLPVAISTVGKALQGESLPKWRNALRQLRKACPEGVPGVIKDVYGKIELSYQCLPSEEAKSCFLLCCLFRKSQGVPTETFILTGLGLGLFKGIGSISEGRDNVKALLDTLKARFLLLDGEMEWCYKMHDVVYDVAMYIASEESTPKKKDQLQRKLVLREGMEGNDWRKSKGIEQSTLYRSLATNMNTTELLLLWDNRKLELSASIFDGMEDLKVLVIKNSVLPSLPLSKKLQTLILEHCHVSSVDIIGELQTLMILNLDGSDVKQLPDTFKNLSNLRVLSLWNCRKLKVISPGVISSLSCLEELYMLDTFDGWRGWVVDKMASTETTDWISQLEDDARPEEVHMWRKLNEEAVEDLEKFNISYQVYEHKESMKRWGNSMDWTVGILSELLSLSTLTTLEVRLPPLEILLTSKLFNKLESFKINIGWEDHFMSSENLMVVQDLDASSLGGISVLLKETKTLKLKMKNLTEPPLNCCAKLESLTLRECDSLEYLIDTTLNQDTPRSIFPVLNELRICHGGRRLKEIFHGDLPPGSLKKLERIDLEDLPALTTIWSTKSQSRCVGDLAVLNEIRITGCKSLEYIFAWEESGDHEEEAEAKEITFSALKRLTLSDLPNLRGMSKSICKRGQVTSNALFSDPKVLFPVLKHLLIKRLGNLEKIWNSQRLSPDSFCELRDLYVKGCDKLLHLVPTQMQNGLQRLEKILVVDCSSLQYLIGMTLNQDHEEEAEAKEINFSALERLTLSRLPNWRGIRKSICRRGQVTSNALFWDPKVLFPVLKYLCIKRLGNLEKIWNSQRLSPDSFCELERLHVEGCDKLLHLVPTQMQNGLQRLEGITVCECPSLEEIFEVHEANASISQSDNTPSNSSQPDQAMQMNHIMDFKTSCQGFQNLTELFVDSCDNLRYVLSPSIARGLVKLTKMDIRNCEKIEEIVLADEGEGTEDENMLPQLSCLRLRSLPNLESFSQGRYTFDWSLICEITIEGCKKNEQVLFRILHHP